MIVRSVLGAGTFVLVDGCVASIVVHDNVKHTLQKLLNIKILTDSETLFNFIISRASTTDQRLMIDEKSEVDSRNDEIIGKCCG